MPLTTASSDLRILGDCQIEILTDGPRFLGLGQITIGQVCVRSGRLPLRVTAQSFQAGSELDRLDMIEVIESASELRLRLSAHFRQLEIKLMRDHSFDPIHDQNDWASEQHGGTAEIDLVLRPAHDCFNGVNARGFSYHWEYRSTTTPIHWLMDKASWELDGDIVGATIFNQSACSKPVVEVVEATDWSTEGFLYFLDPTAYFNRCMTHNLPRWASHQCFDFQWKNGRALLGVFARVNLIRSLLRREPGKAELKCFDKHIFDESNSYETTPKNILLVDDVATPTAARNLWTWTFDELHQRARAEYGLHECDPIPVMGHHHWVNFTIETYYKDIVPACVAVGIKSIFAENFKKSDAAEPNRLHTGNMCTSHEYEISEHHGGATKFKEFITRTHKHGIKTYMWTNNFLSLQAKLNNEGRIEKADSWFMAMDDTRLKYAGAYTSVSSNLDFKNPDARRWWTECHLKIAKETGLDGYFIDSFYNLFFMPVDYKAGHPSTVWREGLQVMKSLQDAGIGWQIESFGPFGQNLHGHPDSYDPANVFICYHIGYGNNYVTVPVPGTETTKNVSHDPGFIFYALANKVPIAVPLFIDDQRIDHVYGPEHRAVIAAYHTNLPQMRRRYLQESNNCVLWHDETGTTALIWNFVRQNVVLSGIVTELATGTVLPTAHTYLLEPRRIYSISGHAPLPTEVVEQ